MSLDTMSLDTMSLDTMASRGMLPIPTPTVKGNYAQHGQGKAGDGLATWATKFFGPGPLHPEFVEWVMGFPRGWTDCPASETLWCLSAPKSLDG